MLQELRKAVEREESAARSAWRRGVCAYAFGLLDDAEEFGKIEEIKTAPNLQLYLLNGAEDWTAYSWGGSALIYNSDIAKRLCTPSELKKTRNGERQPNSREDWLDVQARALYQAYIIIRTEFFKIKRGAK